MNVTDRQMDRQTPADSKDRAYAQCHMVKTKLKSKAVADVLLCAQPTKTLNHQVKTNKQTNSRLPAVLYEIRKQ